MELLGSRLVERGDIELQHDVDDILLRAWESKIPELNLGDIAGELSKMHAGDGFINPRDDAFKQELIDVIQKSDLVQHVDTGRVVLKKPGDMTPSGEEPGEEIKKVQDKQHDKNQKTAMKNIKSGGNEL